MKRVDWLIIFILTISYLILLYTFKNNIFSYKFSYETVKRYLCSQDIPYEPPCKRIIVSDEEIHIAAGYLYAKGEDPSVINFQHMPFIAYLYGLTAIYFKNPYLLELFFGVIYLFLIYYLGIKIFKNRLISLLSILLILIDPLFIDISTQTSYELGQAVFNLLYFFSVLIWKNWFLSGIFLAMFAGSKFYGAVIFFVILYHLYLYLKKEFEIRSFILSILTAFFIFNLFYIKSYLKQGLNFNIFFFQLKVIRFWINHSLTNLPFASLLLFILGIFKKWWGNYQFTFSHIYSFFWPMTLFAGLYLLKVKFFNNKKMISKIMFKNDLLKRNLDFKVLVYLISPLYLIYLGMQSPFVRYFVIILPFSYLTLADFLARYILKRK